MDSIRFKKLFARFFKIEKRRSERFHIGDHTLVISGPNCPEETQVKDLSSEGISFIYTDTGSRLNQVFDIDLIVGDEFQLGEVRIKIVSDKIIGEITQKSKTIKLLKARFINISSIQSYKLTKFLKTHGEKLE